jgi:hypothetical protein
MNSGIEIVTHTHTLRIDLDVITHLPPVLTNWRRVRLWAELLGVEPGDEPARQLADPICDRVYLGLWRATADLNTSIYRSVFRTHIEVRSCFDGCAASRCIATESRYRQILLLLARIHSRIGEHGRAAAVVAACLVAGDIRRRLQLPADGRARQCWIAVSHLLSVEVSLTRSLQVRGFVVHFSNILNQARLHPHLWDKEFFIDVDTFL